MLQTAASREQNMLQTSKAAFARQTKVGKLKLVCVNDTTTIGKQVGKLLVRIETSSILPPTVGQLVCRCCIVHTHQLEFANTSWPIVFRVKAAFNAQNESCQRRIRLFVSREQVMSQAMASREQRVVSSL